MGMGIGSLRCAVRRAAGRRGATKETNVPPLGFHSQGLSGRRAATICTIIPVWNGEVCDIQTNCDLFNLTCVGTCAVASQKQHLYRIRNWRDYNRAAGSHT
jgi:hypothetical protein